MKKMRVFLALLAARLVRFALRITKRGGTALPGKVALKICPDLLTVLARDVKVLIVTGTNGKTTSCRIAEQLMQEAGYRYFANRGGANLVQGITTEFAMHACLSGRPKQEYAVIECDEAVMPEVCRRVQPVCILVTNVFADQVDRFGGVDHTVEVIRKGIMNAPAAAVCLNADCSMLAEMSEGLENPLFFYGVDVPLYRERVNEISDAPRCPKCGTDFAYRWHTYGHLGGFACPGCGFARPEPAVRVTRLVQSTLDGSRIEISLQGRRHTAAVAVPGGYNVYNAAGVASAGTALGLDDDVILRALGNFTCGFGRMEKMQLAGNAARMILVKNPAGCNQTLNFLSNIDGSALFVIAINDNVGDGTDIGWIYDADFEKLLGLGERLTGLYCAGARGAEMALRLKYAGFPMEKIRVFADYESLIAAMEEQTGDIVMMPTYSAMMELRGKLAARYGLKEFWE